VPLPALHHAWHGINTRRSRLCFGGKPTSFSNFQLWSFQLDLPAIRPDTCFLILPLDPNHNEPCLAAPILPPRALRSSPIQSLLPPGPTGPLLVALVCLAGACHNSTQGASHGKYSRKTVVPARDLTLSSLAGTGFQEIIRLRTMTTILVSHLEAQISGVETAIRPAPNNLHVLAMVSKNRLKTPLKHLLQMPPLKVLKKASTPPTAVVLIRWKPAIAMR
jgi:hypothetical protein